MTNVEVTVHGPEDEVDRDVRRLRTELLELDVDDVTLRDRGPAPEGAKSGGAATVTTLVVALAGSPVLVRLGMVLQDWVGRGSGRRITVRDGERSIEIVGDPGAEGRRAIDQFFRRS